MLNRDYSYKIFVAYILVELVKKTHQNIIGDVLKHDHIGNNFFKELKFNWGKCNDNESKEHIFNYAIKELKRYYVNKSSTSEENYESPQDKVRWVIDGDTICF